MPTAVVCSDEFGPLGRAEAQVLGMPALPLIAIPHPLAGNAPDLVTRKAAALADELGFALTARADDLEQRFATQFLNLSERRLAAGEICLDEVCAIDLEPLVVDATGKSPHA